MERMTLYFVLCSFCWIYFHKCLCSEVKLTATPSAITNGLTDTLKLRCSLQDTTDASSVVVGRQVSFTSYDIEHVNSIIISRANPDATVTSLAEIVMSENANVLDDLQTLMEVGTLTPSDPADPEYLELTWTNPGEEQSGSYTCEVNGLDPQGHGVMLQKSMAVSSADPEVRDLVKELNSLKATFTLQYQDLAKENNDLKATVDVLTLQIKDLTKENNDLKATVDVLTLQIQDLDKENDDLKATVNGLTSEIQNLAKENNDLRSIVATHKAPHTEKGEVQCGNSDSWPSVPGTTSTKELVIPVTFRRPYSSLPVISIADVAGDVLLDSTDNLGHHWAVSGVTTTGFNIICATWTDTHYKSKIIGWTSFVA